MGRAKNHHIVPKVLQRQFTITNEPDRIWRAKLGEHGNFNAPEKKSIRKTFVIRDYYTTRVDHKRSDHVERNFYGPIDDFWGQILYEVMPILENGDVPSLNSELEMKLRLNVMQMAKRTPDFMNYPDDLEIGFQLIQTCLDILPDNYDEKYRNQLKKELQNKELLSDKGRDIRVTGTLRNSKLLEEILSEFSVRWVVSDSKHSFILSSLMVYRIGNGRNNGLSNPQCEVWMPISPKVVLVLVRDPNNKINNRIIWPSERIRKFNEFAAANSFEIASHPERLLSSLIRSL
jgi:hypothetical protein